MTEPTDGEFASLLAVPGQVVGYLRNQPALLIGMGGATLLAIVAIFAPGDKAVFGWLISGVVFLVCLAWAIAGTIQRQFRDEDPDAIGTSDSGESRRGNTFVVGRGSQVRRVRMDVEGETSNRLRTGTRSRVQGVEMRASGPDTAPRLPGTAPHLPETGAASRQELAPGPAADEASSRLFVGRRRELDEVFGLLANAGDGALLDVVGVRGIGKSSLLDQIAVQARQHPDTLVRQVNMADLVDGYRDDSGVDASLAVLEHTFTQAARLMRTMAGPSSRSFAGVWERIELTRRSVAELQVSNTLQLGANARASRLHLGSSLTVNLPDEAIRSSIRRQQAMLDDAFVEAWSQFTLRQRVVVTIDTFERCADDELGHWIMRLALRLPNTLVVVARIPSELALPIESARVRRCWLDSLSRDETAVYLDRRLRGEPVQTDVAEVVYGFTAGHAGGVYLLGELISDRGPEAVSAAELRRIMRRLPEDPTQAWSLLVDEILPSPPERSSARAAAVVSCFNEPLLAELISDHLESEGQAATEIMAALLHRRLLRPIPTPSGEANGWFRMHEFIRQSFALRLRAQDPRQWLALHSTAATYFYGLLDRWDDTQGCGMYGSWFRYEHPDWQRYKREWLYHDGQSIDDRPLTRTRFAVVLLEAFWWWGCYHPFDFNRHLIDDWERATDNWQPMISGPDSAAAEQERDRQFGDALLFLLNNYPTGHVKPATAPWAEIAERLRLVRRLCVPSPSRAAAEPTREAAKLAALTSLFLAHTQRYADPGAQRADRYYAQARTRFEDLGDTWTVAWTDMERADLALSRGRYELVGPLVAESARLARLIGLGADDQADDWDHELLANLHRILADGYWQRGALVEAAAEYGRAVADAYWFQCVPHPPDEYTQRFYQEITGRAAEALGALVARGNEAAARHFACGMEAAGPTPSTLDEDTLSRLTQFDRSVELAGTLFPAGPTGTDLRTADSPFLSAWDIAREDAPSVPQTLATLLAADTPATDLKTTSG